MITTNEAFSVLSGWQENNIDIEVVEIGGIESVMSRARCIIVGVDRRAETITVLYETPRDGAGQHCFDLRETLFHFEANHASPGKTTLLADYPSHKKIFFMER